MRPADRIYWLHALSPMHVGMGRGESYIDLPLLREKATNFPLVPGSAIKGVLADRHGADDKVRATDPLLRAAWGMGGEEHASAGSLVLTDARLVSLPIRSVYGTFAWCTSRLVLRRLRRDLEAAALTDLPAVPDPDPADPAMARLPDDPASALATDGTAYLEDLDLVVRRCAATREWAHSLAGWVFPDDSGWQQEFQQRFAVLPDDVFNFLCATGTEVQAHVRIEDDCKRVAERALWYEESLPAETILAGLVWCDRIFGGDIRREDIVAQFCTDTEDLQIGGKATVGKGRVRCHFTPGGSKP